MRRSHMLVARFVLSAAAILAPAGASAQVGEWWRSLPDSAFFPGVVFVSFRPSAIRPDYFCAHPWPRPGISADLPESRTFRPSIAPTTELIPNGQVVQFLLDRCATLVPQWSEILDPCGVIERQRLAGNGMWGLFWTEYAIRFPDALDVRDFASGLAEMDGALFAGIAPSVKHSLWLRAAARSR